VGAIRSMHQYNIFCYYSVIESAIAKSLEKIAQSDCGYMVEYAKKLEGLRNLLVTQLLKCKFDIDFWIPKGSNFIIVDISRC
jgi:hypothetical protein